jgi:membrane peptidoglycan carboxypeptidase
MSVVITPNPPPASAPEAPRPGPSPEREQPAAIRGGPPKHRGMRRAARIVLVCLIAAATAFEANVASDPSVAGAPAVVAAIDRTHGSTAVMVAPSDRIAQALVASEDDTFYSNNGVDDVALVRAFWGFVTGQDLGGSTIEMQLAHMLFPAVTDGFWGRVRRVSLALEFDTHFTKAAILSMYLSAVYFGHDYYGIRAASLGYFGVSPAELSWAQAALLAGIVQAPSALDPFRHLRAAEARMSYVLQRLVQDGVLTPTQVARLEQSPLGLVKAPPAAH